MNAKVEICRRRDLTRCLHWPQAFATERKDHRYYEIIEDTIHPEFDYHYFVVRDGSGSVCAVQPFFVLDQDLLVGISPAFGPLIDGIRNLSPRFMQLRTLMVGCVAGEGHLDATGEPARHSLAHTLATAIVEHAQGLRVSLIVLKEFPAHYRASLGDFLEHGFSRVPSLPMTRVRIDYAGFDDYMDRALNSATRTKLRRKFRAAALATAIEMTVIRDVTSVIDDIYPLYLNVYNRSKLHFEKLTEEYFCRLGRLMPDKVRFFVWRQNQRTVAFAECMLQGDDFYAEYIGLDYTTALELHLYHYIYRDMVSWAIANGYKEFRSSGLNYDPKLHWRHRLDPIDLYVRHTSPTLNRALRLLLPVIEPTRHDRTLRKFANYSDIWGI